MLCSCLQNWGFPGGSLGLCDECLTLFASRDVASILNSRAGMKFGRHPYDTAKKKCDLCFFLSARYTKKSIISANSKSGDGDDDFWILRKLLSWFGGSRLTCKVRGDLKTEEPLEVQRWDGWWPLKKKYLKLSVSRGQYFTSTHLKYGV